VLRSEPVNVKVLEIKKLTTSGEASLAIMAGRTQNAAWLSADPGFFKAKRKRARTQKHRPAVKHSRFSTGDAAGFERGEELPRLKTRRRLRLLPD